MESANVYGAMKVAKVQNQGAERKEDVLVSSLFYYVLRRFVCVD
jgi:hypothetical protein